MHSERLIFVAGLGSTGSSAVCDILQEYEGVICPDEEWRIWVDPDGLLDLANSLGKYSTFFQHTEGIHRFKRLVRRLSRARLGPYSKLTLPQEVKSLFEDIAVQVCQKLEVDDFRGLWYRNSNHISATLNFRPNRIFWKNFLFTKLMHVYPNAHEGGIHRRLGEIVEERIFETFPAESNSIIAINENFSILRAREILQMHPDARIVLVLRDPLDVYADSHRVGWLAMPYNIEQFISWQNNMHMQVNDVFNELPDKILPLRFEDLCRDYDAQRKRLEQFLPNTLVRSDELRFFPEKSKLNIGQWKHKFAWLEDYRNRFAYNRNGDLCI